MKRFSRLIYDKNETSHSDEYYQKWAVKFNLVKSLSLISLLLAIIISVLFFADGMTYDNVQLLANVIDSEYNSMISDDSFGITYTLDDDSVFDIYNENLIISSPTDVALYNMSGRRLYSYTVSYENPCLESNDRFFILYDLGGFGFSVYNKTGKIYEQNDYSYGILTAAVSDKGRYCIATKSRESNTCVFVYDSKHRVIGRYDNSLYLSSMAISDDGEFMALSMLEAVDGVYNSVLWVYKLDTAELIYEKTNPEKLPLRVFFTEDNSVLLCCSDELFRYNKSGEAEYSCTYDSSRLSGIEFNGKDSLAMSFSYENSNSKNYMNCIDTSEKVVYNIPELSKVKKMSFFDDALFVLSGNSIFRIKGEELSKKELELQEEAETVYAISEYEVIVVYATHSEIISIG